MPEMPLPNVQPPEVRPFLFTVADTLIYRHVEGILKEKFLRPLNGPTRPTVLSRHEVNALLAQARGLERVPLPTALARKYPTPLENGIGSGSFRQAVITLIPPRECVTAITSIPQ
jgi:hypothetical protein